MYELNKTINDFPSGFNMGKFHNEVLNSGYIVSTTFYGLSQNADNIVLIFENEPTNGEKTSIDNLITAHSGTFTKEKTQFRLYPPKKYTSYATQYEVVCIIKIASKNRLKSIDYFEVLSYKSTDITSYSLRIFDKTNGLVIAEKNNITNNTLDEIDLGTISNEPEGEAILELQVKKIGGATKSNVYIEGVEMYFGNNLV